MRRRPELVTVAVAVAAAAFLGWLLVRDELAGAALALLLPGTLLALWLAPKPRLAFGLYLGSIALVPVWAAVDVGVVLTPSAVAFLLVLPALLRAGGRLRIADWWMGALLVLCALAAIVYDSPQYAVASLLVNGVTAYLVGRRLAPAAGEDWTYRAMAVAASVVAAWALVEFVLDWHVFAGFVGRPEESFWSDVQIRGGVARSEGAFGHSIALGGFVAMGIPFVIGGPFSPRRKVLLSMLLFAGVLASLSRGPMIGAVLAFLLATLLLASDRLTQRARVSLVLLGAAGLALVLPWISAFFVAIGPEETEVSTDYREDLLENWTRDLNLFGQADFVRVTVAGITVYRNFASIDNAWLQMGLQFGWVPMLAAAFVVAVAVARVLTVRGGPAEVAVASQAFILGTVALITQYGTSVWLLAGLAISFAGRGRKVPPPPGAESPASDAVPLSTGTGPQTRGPARAEGTGTPPKG